ncbi:Mob as tumor suppressor 4 [Hyphodiscus hymeniophilus]|uniref:Mob as tumor suppressor 4 n=1 Tax=Hyphodiscus hymeniophilus TaxID=353542 RepID=A0A9P6VJF0_9HELO|nr:Mob as tumor suppressor 4 [Hyphodiscus hymeniophilus]
MALPPSSPRLPSPPPPTEIQIGPKSPSISSTSEGPTIEQSTIDANATRRIHPGTKSADMAAGPPLIPLGELDSAFQLQEHLKALHYNYTKPLHSDHTIPITRETANLIATQPEGLDRALWLYELCRFLINKCNDLIIGFLFDDPPCSATTCPEMRASEWQFLCAVHESPKSCCAIDYCCHTLDWATNIVTSQKIFPSRLSLAAGDSVDDRGAGVKHLINIFRRLHRIFAHAWFQHRGVFWQVEAQTGLYVLFKTVCDNYELLPAENYKLPPEAEGLEPVPDIKAAAPTILKSQAPSENVSSVEEDFIGVGRTNTRRHIRQSPSVGSAVTTVLETDEEDPDVTQKLRDMTLAEEEGDSESGTEIPVIVETYEVDDEPSPEQELDHFESVEVETTDREKPKPEPGAESGAEPTPSSLESVTAEITEKEDPPSDAETVVEEVGPVLTETEPEVKVVESASETNKEDVVKEEPEANGDVSDEEANKEQKEEEFIQRTTAFQFGQISKRKYEYGITYIMYKSIVALALLGAATAQTTTTELFLVGFDQQPLVGSVIASDATATTYSIACTDPDSDDCGAPPSFTFTQGPSTVHYQYVILDDGDGDNETIDLGCEITNSESGVCSGTVLGSISASATSSASTTSFSNGGSELGGQIVTITAGLAAAATTASSTATTSSTGSSESSSKSAASGKSTATSTGAEQTAAAGSSSSSSSSSTGGVPRITGNAQWVMGGAAAALAMAAL